MPLAKPLRIITWMNRFLLKGLLNTVVGTALISFWVLSEKNAPTTTNLLALLSVPFGLLFLLSGLLEICKTKNKHKQ